MMKKSFSLAVYREESLFCCILGYAVLAFYRNRSTINLQGYNHCFLQERNEDTR
jgi:hypothetical protein